MGKLEDALRDPREVMKEAKETEIVLPGHRTARVAPRLVVKLDAQHGTATKYVQWWTKSKCL